MSKLTNGVFEVPGGFTIQNPNPIDDRQSVDLLTDLTSATELPLPYPGIIVAVADENYDLYRWNGLDRTQSTNWILVGSGSGGGSLPNGGTADQLLVKQSSTDGDAQWDDVAAVDFSSTHVSRLIALVYEDGTASLSRTPSTFEKNLTSGTDITFTYSSVTNDDTIQSATWDGNDVTSTPNGNETFTGVKTTLSKSYNVTFLNSDGVTTRNDNNAQTATALDPQWKGSATSTTGFDGSTYSNLNTNLTKFVQSGFGTSITVPAGEYGIFISKNAGRDVVEQGTGFALASSAYSENTITVEYEDGTSLQLTQYIINASSGAFTYTLS